MGIESHWIRPTFPIRSLGIHRQGKITKEFGYQVIQFPNCHRFERSKVRSVLFRFHGWFLWSLHSLL